MVPAIRGKVVEALVRLGRAVQKTTIYPQGHPEVPAAVNTFLQSLREAVEESPVLSLGVARDRLLLDGESLDERNEVLAWLAEHMHEHGIGAIDLGRNIPEEDGVRFVHWLARPPAADLSTNALPNFEGIGLTRYDYARVRFGEESATDRDAEGDPVRVWTALMSGLFAGGDAAGPALDFDDPTALAKELGSRIASREPGSAAAVASRVIAMGPRLGDLPAPAREAVKKRIGTFIGGLTTELRTELLRVDPRSSRQKLEFVTEIVDALPDTIVLDVLGDLDRTGARVPHQFITLMNKLIGLSGSAPPLRRNIEAKLESIGIPQSLLTAQPEKVRSVLEEVLQSRIERNWNPEHYQSLLEDLSAQRVAPSSGSFSASRYGDPGTVEDVSSHVSEIVLRLLVDRPEAPEAIAFVRRLDDDAPRALETGRFEQLHEAASVVKDLAATRRLLPDDLSKLAEVYLANLGREEQIEKILSAVVSQEGPPAPWTIGLFRIAGTEAAYAAFQRLADSLEQEARESEILADLLSHAEPDAFNAAVARLRMEDWSRLRCLFPVLLRIGGTRAVELAFTFLGNEDHRVRAEAYRVLLSTDQRPGQAERYIERALGDEIPRVAGYALGQARQRGGSVITGILGAFLKREDWDHDLRLRTVSILAGFRTAEARDILVALISRRRINLWVAQFQLYQALEEGLGHIGDEPSLAAVKAWRRSPERWISMLLVRGRVERGEEKGKPEE